MFCFSLRLISKARVDNAPSNTGLAYMRPSCKELVVIGRGCRLYNVYAIGTQVHVKTATMMSMQVLFGHDFSQEVRTVRRSVRLAEKRCIPVTSIWH